MRQTDQGNQRDRISAMPKQIAPYGSWKSPVTSDAIVSESVGLGQIVLEGSDIYWIEARPTEAGRNVIVRQTADGRVTDVTPAPFSARTRVHEYGGGAYTVAGGTVFFSNDADQRLYRQEPRAQPRPISARSPATPSWPSMWLATRNRGS